MPSSSHRPVASALILTASALGLGAFGILLLFAPSETASVLGWGTDPVAPSLAASGFLALAILDWMGRGAVYGGIYGRPLIMANVTFALTGGLALFNAQSESAHASVLGWGPVVLLALHGLGFFFILWGPGPGQVNDKNG